MPFLFERHFFRKDDENIDEIGGVIRDLLNLIGLFGYYGGGGGSFGSRHSGGYGS